MIFLKGWGSKRRTEIYIVVFIAEVSSSLDLNRHQQKSNIEYTLFMIAHILIIIISTSNRSIFMEVISILSSDSCTRTVFVNTRFEGK